MVTANSSISTSENGRGALAEGDRRRYASYLCILTATIIAAHAACIFVGHAILDSIYKREPRIINVRIFPDKQRSHIFNDFLFRKIGHRSDAVVIVGDSQTYGTGKKWPSTFGAELQSALPAARVFNASGIDFSYADNIELINLLRSSGVRPKVLVININLSRLRAAPDANPRRLPASVADPLASIVPLYFLTPWRLRRLIEEQRLAPHGNGFVFTALDNNFLNLTTSEQDPELKRVEHDLLAMLEAAAGAADRVVAFTSPLATDAFAHYRFDRERVSVANRAALSLCESVVRKAGNVDCLDLFEALVMSDFIDILHFSDRGHAKMAEILRKRIEPFVRIRTQ
jgi:hypothetical protein